MSNVQHIEVKDDDDGMRLDRWLRARFPELNQGRVQKLLRTGQVRVNGARAKAAQRLAPGENIRVPPLGDSAPKKSISAPISKSDRAFAESLILYQDDHVIALNKPYGIPVQGGTKVERHIDGLIAALQFDKDEKPRLVHRLDRDTSGVLLLARTRKVASILGKTFRTRSARKIYWALVVGVPRPAQGKISLPLLKQPGPQGDRMHVVRDDVDGAQQSTSFYSVVGKAAEKLSWISLKPVTGRTHQLRVHMAYIGHPIVGDVKYGEELAFPGGEIPEKMHLHARRLTVPHPVRGTLDITAPLPPHMQESWDLLNFDARDGDANVELLDQ